MTRIVTFFSASLKIWRWVSIARRVCTRAAISARRVVFYGTWTVERRPESSGITKDSIASAIISKSEFPFLYVDLAQCRCLVTASRQGHHVKPRSLRARDSAFAHTPLGAMASANAPVAVDGSILEGGGQIVRVAAALSAATGREVRVDDIRAGRPKPGLAAQHLAGLLLVRDATGGSLRAPEGGDVGVGATSFVLAPGSVEAAADAAAVDGDASPSHARFSSNVHTAGSVSLVAQTIVPVCAFAGRPSRIILTGGTDVNFAPPVGYLQHCLAPCLRKHLDLAVHLEVKRRGYFPRGRGEVVLTVAPPPRFARDQSESSARETSSAVFQPFVIERPRANRGGNGEPAKLGCWIINGARDGKRMQTESRAAAASAFRALLDASPTVAVAAEAMAKAGVPVDVRTAVEPGLGDGGSIVVRASSVDETVHLTVASSFEPPIWNASGTDAGAGFGAEDRNARLKGMLETAARCGEALGELVESGAAVDDHLLDQLIVFMALADGSDGKKSRVVARAPISEHARTAVAVCEAMTGARFSVTEGDAGGVREGLCAVECVGVGAKRR